MKSIQHKQFTYCQIAGNIRIMRWLSLGIFVVIFVITPMYLLNTFVMPELQSLKQVYGNADATASSIASQRAPTSR